LAIGAFAGLPVYPLFPSFFNDAIYGREWGFGDEYCAKVHIQTCIALAEGGGVLSFFIGFAVPWLTWIKGRFDQKEPS